MKRTLSAVAVAGTALSSGLAWSQPSPRNDWRGPEIIVQPAPAPAPVWHDDPWRDDERQLGIDTRQGRLRERIDRRY